MNITVIQSTIPTNVDYQHIKDKIQDTMKMGFLKTKLVDSKTRRQSVVPTGNKAFMISISHAGLSLKTVSDNLTNN
jgi:hypothetical protein